MRLGTLLEKMEYTLVCGSLDTEISTLVYDSRKVEKDSAFVCISGTVRDAHDFIPQVVENGATAIIVEKDVTPIDGVTYIRVENSRLALACMSAAYFGYPSEKLKTIGITGTKGKTTTTYMVKSILESAGITSGAQSTVIFISSRVISSPTFSKLTSFSGAFAVMGVLTPKVKFSSLKGSSSKLPFESILFSSLQGGQREESFSVTVSSTAVYTYFFSQFLTLLPT